MKTARGPRLGSASLGVALGVLAGTSYGVLARALAEHGLGMDVMSLAFLFATPFVLGVLSVLPLREPTLLAALTLPITASGLTLAIAFAAGWEGLICIAMAFVPLLGLATLGGLIVLVFHAWKSGRDKNKRLYGLALAPLLLAQLEGRVEAPREQRSVATAISIAASPDDVWEQIVEVAPIQEHERRPALFTSIGFPRPVSALVDRRELGGVRQAIFEGGVLFLEKVTRFEPGRALEFTIDAQEQIIPPTTLDPHVTIGGPYFDVLLGAYEIEPRDGGVILHLRSELRLSTRFNVYAGAWADLVMESIQDNILEIVKARAEAAAAR